MRPRPGGAREGCSGVALAAAGSRQNCARLRAAHQQTYDSSLVDLTAVFRPREGNAGEIATRRYPNLPGSIFEKRCVEGRTQHAEPLNADGRKVSGRRKREAD